MIFLVAGVLHSTELAGVMHGGPCRELADKENERNLIRSEKHKPKESEKERRRWQEEEETSQRKRSKSPVDQRTRVLINIFAVAQIEDNWEFQSLGHGCRADRPAWLVAGIRPFDSAPGQRAGRYALDSGIGMDGEPCGRNTSSAMLHLTRHTIYLVHGEKANCSIGIAIQLVVSQSLGFKVGRYLDSGGKKKRLVLHGRVGPGEGKRGEKVRELRGDHPGAKSRN
ncbi:hypothetical protein BO83DRAFT_413598 [Aspergillus eucalypticola CBS 122712]|uniref:Uncharacterized protein n=1 Tax=Aspergillus eucalypticola (strain CBS 122712 / IBT 29274) TaxID=1448314 RepID=A0A317WGE4_ASPEC|nr:uncharacterized protein BO83DRAFT_413598 [Aspergillus eucalypticola CBS 122712]PWY84098.1 hypothetical protein BO83DRAFT_413598 [Aspergillus eucalypticola CBS 122712]